MLGRFIDALSDEQRDRIVAAQKWDIGGMSPLGRCLLQHAYDTYCWSLVDLPAGWPERDPFCIAARFDYLCRRFGTDRIARACKLRAAATTSRKVEAQPAEAHR